MKQAAALTIDHDAFAAAVESLRSIGAKLTTPRRLILGLLQAAPAPQTHRDVLEGLHTLQLAGIDRVTVYRVLDWLVEQGLAHKAADGQGIFRFSQAQPGMVHESHVHFRCTRCGGVFCLKDAPPQRPKLPKGFRLGGMTVDIRGECASCVTGIQ